MCVDAVSVVLRCELGFSKGVPMDVATSMEAMGVTSAPVFHTVVSPSPMIPEDLVLGLG